MKYLHRFHNTAELNQYYNSGSTFTYSDSSGIVAGDYIFYDDDNNYGDGLYHYITSDGQHYFTTSVSYPGQGESVTILPDNITAIVNGYVNEVTIEEEGLYQEPFIAVVDGETTPVFNRKSIGQNIGIDLGLPSGLIWAECNIGAKFQGEHGDFFAWGEVAPKQSYTWSTYRYGDGTNFTRYGSVDNIYTLKPEDDPATVILGPKWRTPTYDEYAELRHFGKNDSYDFLTMESGYENGVIGVKVRNTVTGKYIFFPQWGSMCSSDLVYNGSLGRYWTATLSDDSHPFMWGWCHIPDAEAYVHDDSLTRELGCPIRAVMEPDNYVPYKNEQIY